MRLRTILWTVAILAIFATGGFFIKYTPDDRASAESRVESKAVEQVRPAVTKTSPQRGTGTSAVPGLSLIVQKRYPSCPVIETREEQLAGNQIRRIEVVHSQKKYPFIRVETLLERDPASGNEKVLTVQEYVADQVAVSLREGKHEEELREAVAAVGGQILRRLELDYASTYLVALRAPTIDAVPDAIQQLSLAPEVVATADVNGLSWKQVTPNDSSFPNSWHLHNSDEVDIDAIDAWSVHTGSSSVVIGISDTGVDYNHPDLAENIWANPDDDEIDGRDDDQNRYIDDVRGWDFVSGDNSPMDLDSSGGHGTQVAGLIGARGNNGIGTAGVMWQCQIIPLRTLDEEGGGFYSDIAEAFNYARRAGAKIINASHGGDSSSSLIEDAIDDLQSYGVLLIAPAGNESRNTDVYPLYPASYPNENVISVAATTSSDSLSYFSNFGEISVDLAAPGSDIYSTAPGGSYDTLSGTSFSAPIVAGMAGLLKAKNPSWTYLQIRSALLTNVDRKPDLTGNCATGGRANLYKAIVPRVSLATALDGNGFSWTTGGNAAWWGVAPSSATDWAESGGITDSQQSWVRATVSGPGTVAFSWKVSSEVSYDILSFQLDGVTKVEVSGEVNWDRRFYSIGPGSHTLLWTYRKDEWLSTGNDAAWLDNVSLAGVGPTITTHPASKTVNPGSNVIFSVATYATPPLSYQWLKNGVNIAGATKQTFVVSNAQPAQAGNYSVQVRNAYGQAISNPATLSFCSITVAPSSTSFGNGGGARSISVATTGPCPWTAATTNTWISFTSSATGQGSGTVSYVVAANPQRQTRIGAIMVQGRKVIVTQLGKLAPAFILGRNFVMSVTNRTGTATSSGSFLLFARSTNAFKLVPLSGLIQPASGPFRYTLSANSALLALGPESGSTNVQLTFTTPSTGRFTSTMPDASTQSGTFVLQAIRPDFNGDGGNDLLLLNSNRILNAWLMSGTNFVQPRRINTAPLDTAWRVVGVGGVSNNFGTDIILQSTNRQLAAWLMPNGTNVSAVVQLRPGVPTPAGWKAVGLHDFNRDGKLDVLLQHSNRTASVWCMNGTQFLRSSFLNNGVAAGLGWEIAGVGDFNDDGEGDILWQHQDGRLAAWTMVGLEFVASVPVCENRSPGSAWRVAAINDFNRDGRNDLLFQHSDGRLVVWFLQNATFRSAAFIQNGQPASSAGAVVAPR
jgi:subtilisin family serine protease